MNRPSPQRLPSVFTLFHRLLALPEHLAGLFRRRARRTRAAVGGWWSSRASVPSGRVILTANPIEARESPSESILALAAPFAGIAALGLLDWDALLPVARADAGFTSTVRFASDGMFPGGQFPAPPADAGFALPVPVEVPPVVTTEAADELGEDETAPAFFGVGGAEFDFGFNFGDGFGGPLGGGRAEGAGGDALVPPLGGALQPPDAPAGQSGSRSSPSGQASDPAGSGALNGAGDDGGFFPTLPPKAGGDAGGEAQPLGGGIAQGAGDGGSGALLSPLSTSVDGSRVADGPAAKQRPVARPGGAVPSYFERNVGQVNSAVNYVARGSGYTLFLTPNTMTVAGRVPGLAGRGPQTDLVRLRLAGANPTAVATGVGDMDLKVAYLRGTNSANWVTNVPTVARVNYANVYSGVDATYYAAPDRGLSFDFTVRPGGSASAIRLAADGGVALAVTTDGRLSVTTARGTLTLSAPVAYQDGPTGRTSVAAGFIQRADGIGFTLGAHDAARAVVIDPSISYGSFIGGSADDWVYAVASDAAGNAYLAGYSYSADLPGQWNGAPGNATSDVMVAKLSPDGKRLLYVSYIGGTGDDIGVGIAVNAAGNAFVVGETTSTDFPTTPGVLDTSGSGNDGFAMKLAADGQSRIYATYISPTGSAFTSAHGVAVDSSTGQAVVVGSADVNLNYTTATVIGTGTGGAYVLRLNSAGTTAVYNTTLVGSTGIPQARGVALDSSGNVFATGEAYTSDFMGTSGGFRDCGRRGRERLRIRVHQPGSRSADHDGRRVPDDGRGRDRRVRPQAELVGRGVLRHLPRG